MASASLRAATARVSPSTALESPAARNLRTVQGMVDGFATQDINRIMALMADDAVYCDILGEGVRGVEYRGKAAIREAFSRQFDVAGRHTYVDARIIVDDDLGFASWTMVLGDPDDIKAARFEGIDQFAFDHEGQVLLKKAWLKGQPRLRRELLARNPKGMFRHLGYAVASWGK